MPPPINRVKFSAPLRRAGFRVEKTDASVETAYQKGFADASEFLSKQIAEQRGEVVQLMEHTFKSLEEQHGHLLRQVGEALPELAVEIARRVLCGLEPDRERIKRAVDEVLGELAPNTRDVEITMHRADLELLASYEERFRDLYPGVRFAADDSLTVGDCKMRSSFGLVDATIATKLEKISRSLK